MHDIYRDDLNLDMASCEASAANPVGSDQKLWWSPSKFLKDTYLLHPTFKQIRRDTNFSQFVILLLLFYLIVPFRL
jgi:hypothetical protein